MEGGSNDYGGHLAELLEGGAAAADAGPFPFFGSRTIRAAAILILWATSSIILVAVLDLSLLMLLCFSLLIAGVALLTFAVAAPRFPVAARAAETLKN